MKTAEIRSTYLAHFADRGHRVVPSVPLIPSSDPTILFTVAGMVPFKDALTGVETLPFSRATSCQRCVRAGGKHNDLENVGYTARHHTFFEMLGNFSFGDYFKEDAISWAWEFVQNVLNLEKDRLWFTVHPSDAEARKLWTDKIGIDSSRVVNQEDNFWAMGDTGPCGPCSEIFFDQGPTIAGGPPGSPNEDGDRFLEIWNLVFPQFDRQPDGALSPLDKPGVDTGLGLERLAAVMQGVSNNYQIDVFRPIFDALARMLKLAAIEGAIAQASCRVVVDHVRSASFLISDGILPDREGRGYVLRRIIRRALRHGHKLGIEEPFFHDLVKPLVETMRDAYPELAAAQTRIEQTLCDEEVKFGETLQRGMAVLGDALNDLSGNLLPGELAFKLYDTYGFPIDLTADVAREQGLAIDRPGFDKLMSEQQSRARAAGQFQARENARLTVDGVIEFVGYDQLTGDGRIAQIFTRENDAFSESSALAAGQCGAIVLDRTAFYGEAGGQVGDIGMLACNESQFRVTNVTRINEQFVHHGEVLQGNFSLNQTVHFDVDSVHRQDVARNHSATHLLHAALKATLGDHVRQRGSLVEAARLRFDFAHDRPLASQERIAIEDQVNEQILSNAIVITRELPFKEAVENGAVALFGEKYDDMVRVLDMGNGYSVELCGGTHVIRLGEIGLFRITSESGIAAGVRRIEAVTGRAAYERYRADTTLLDNLGSQVGVAPNQLTSRIKRLLEERKDLERKLSDSSSMNLRERGEELTDLIVDIGDVKLLAALVDGDADAMMASFDDLRERLGIFVIVLAVISDSKCQLVCGVSKSLTESVCSNDVIAQIGHHVAIRGGGKPIMARAGGSATAQELENALATLPDWLRSRLGA